MKEDEAALQAALPGAQDHGAGLVTFALYAPGKGRVELLGDFNGFKSGLAMTERSSGYWVAAARLDKGPCAYQFLIDGQTLICDPYAQAIAGGDDHPPRAVIDVARPAFDWQHDGWQRPELDDLIIYELNVGDFSPGGDFRGVTERLDYLADLGVNMLELMPVYESAPGDYWGYQPAYYLAPRRAYGSFQDMLTMIDQAHGRGMGTIIDIVLAHTAHEHPFNRMYDYDKSPWYGSTLGEQNVYGLPSFNYRSDATNSFIRDVQAYWLRVAHIDGFRYDYLAGIGADDAQGKGLPYLMKTARDIQPQARLIGECIPEDPPTINASDVDAVWHARCRLALMTLLTGRGHEPYSPDDFDTAAKALDPITQDYARATLMVNYVENHDEERLVNYALEAGADEATALAKAALAIDVLMCLPGEPMLWAGQELAATAKHKMEVNKLDWSLADRPGNRGLLEHARTMIDLRRSHHALRSGAFNMAMVDSHRRCVVIHRCSGEADRVVLAANFSDHSQEFDVPMPAAGQWHFLGEGPIKVAADLKWRLTLQPWQARVMLTGEA